MNTHSFHRWLFLIALLLSPCSRLVAQSSPYVIPFQGRLTNQQGVAYSSGQYTIVFNIYSQSIGGTTQWTERHEKVGVTNGMISVFLGSITPLPTTTGNPPVAFFSTTRYLGITVDADDNAATADPEMVPRQMIIPAFHAKNADKMSSTYGNYDWSVVFGTGVDPGTNNISIAKIPTLTVDKLPDNIPASKLENGAALANLTSSGVSGVTTGGIVLSANANDATLIAAGYTNVGVGQFGEGWKPRRGAYTSARADMASVWTGSKMLVWGGRNFQGTIVSDGGAYNLATDTWSGITETNEPQGRRLPSAVWTGTEMILWGGLDSGGNPLNTGAAYNPATDTWTTLPASPLAARFGNAVVWTGTEMIIWGGSSNGSATSALSDGARLSKSGSTWSWQTMSNTNAPPPKLDIAWSCAWTGNVMIVWGGHTGDSVATNTGGRYNPATNSWTSTTTTNAPSARWAGAMVWTGSEAILWGGINVGAFASAGARYNPATNVWSPINTQGQPSPRYGFGASVVWSGAEFIFWGGNDSGSVGNDGARYSPASDTWARTTSAGVPGRTAHATVWTGTEMLIYGGRGDSGAYFDDLWCYTPPRTLYMYQRN